MACLCFTLSSLASLSLKSLFSFVFVLIVNNRFFSVTVNVDLERENIVFAVAFVAYIAPAHVM